MRRHVFSSLLLLSAALLLCASGCGRLAPAGPPAEAAEVERVAGVFPEDEGGGKTKIVVEKVKATGLATIKGVLRLRAGDDIPTRKVLNVTADKTVCMPDGATVFSKALVINEANQGIANTLIYLRTKTKTIDWETMKIPKPAEVQPVDGDDPANQIGFAQEKCVFLGRVVAARVGQKLNARNLDPVGHNVNGIPGGGVIPGGGTMLIPLEKKATAPIETGCNIHPWMKAWVLPHDNGYFAVTDADGNFEIKNLPAGVLLEFNVWHEIATSPSQRLYLDVAAPENVDVDWTQKRRGRFKITLKPGQTADFGTIEVPVTAFRQ